MTHEEKKSLVIGMNPDGKFVLDNSALSAYYGCTTAGWLRYIQGLTADTASAPLRAGSACHKAREVFYRCGNDIELALSFFDESYKDWASTTVAGDDRLSYTNVYAIVQEYLRSLEPLDNGRFKGSLLAYPDPLNQIEIADLLPLDEAENIWFAFRLDGFATYNHGFAIEEFKTTKKIDVTWKSKWKLSSQITGYLWAARQLFAGPVLGAFVQGLELSQLPSDPSRKCSKHGQKYSECRLLHAKWETVGLLERSDALIEGWKADALDGARKMRDLLDKAPTLESAPLLAQEGTFNNSCQWCQYLGMCETGRQPHLIAANFKVERWSPFADE